MSAAAPFRLGTAVLDGAPIVVLGHDRGADPLPALLPSAPGRVLDLLAAWPAWSEELAAAAAGAPGALDPAALRWQAPHMPPKLICIGANYQAHNAEMLGQLKQPFPFSFLKPPSTTVVASGHPVPLPGYAEQIDYEAELGAVIGPAGDVVAYTIVNDLSVRDWVPGPTVLGIDWVTAKAFDASAPMGPWLTPAAQAGDPQALGIRLWVNDELRQDSSTADMVFTVREQVEHLSRVLTLEPGDVIATGTPAGVGMGFDPPRWLQAGDAIRIEIDGLGVLENTIAPARVGAAT